MKESQTNGKSWLTHLVIVLAMYAYYLYLWYEYFFYEGNAGWKGYGLFMLTLFSAPLYIVFHLAAIVIFRSAGLKKSMRVSLAGLIACIIHSCCVMATI